MRTLYLCGAGNPEGVRLAVVVNRALPRWDRIVLLDDDPAKRGREILGIKIEGPFSLLAKANPETDQVSNLVALTAFRRQAAREKIQSYGVPFAGLLAPSVDTFGVEYEEDITVYPGVSFCAGSSVGSGSVVFTGAVVGHGCRLGHCCVLAPGAVINARVELGDGVYVGTNASILPDLKIGAGATIGANSAVVQHVDAGATVMGVPAQVLIPGRAGSHPPPERCHTDAPRIRAASGSEARTSDSQRGLSPAFDALRNAQRRLVEIRREQPRT